MASETIHLADDFVANAFSEFRGRTSCFAYDWLGRIFALDSARSAAGRTALLMLEPGTGAALEIPCNLSTFHEGELIDYREAVLADSFYANWLAAGGTIPDPHHCVGYKVPLYLGGKDLLENLELSDLDVYWHLSAQLISKAKGLPLGTRVRVKLE